MKKKFKNTTISMQTIAFNDGTTVFMKRGEELVSDQEVKRISKGIRVTDVPVEKKVAPKKTTSSTESDEK